MKLISMKCLVFCILLFQVLCVHANDNGSNNVTRQHRQRRFKRKHSLMEKDLADCDDENCEASDSDSLDMNNGDSEDSEDRLYQQHNTHLSSATVKDTNSDALLHDDDSQRQFPHPNTQTNSNSMSNTNSNSNGMSRSDSSNTSGKKKLIYVEVFAGLGNRLRALASAHLIAQDYNLDLKVLWRTEEPCNVDENVICGNPGFNATWSDLFSKPDLDMVDNFPGYQSPYEEVEGDKDLDTFRATSLEDDGSCRVFRPRDGKHLREILEKGFKMVDGRETLCIKTDQWLSSKGSGASRVLFPKLRPSPTVQKMMDTYKKEHNWEEKNLVGVHMRRTDLQILKQDGTHVKVSDVLSLDAYIAKMKALDDLYPQDRITYFVSSDDKHAQQYVQNSFPPGDVIIPVDEVLSRRSVLGIQTALVNLLLLSECRVLLGTYYSSYSETAKLLGTPFYIVVLAIMVYLSIDRNRHRQMYLQVGEELRREAKETKLES